MSRCTPIKVTSLGGVNDKHAKLGGHKKAPQLKLESKPIQSATEIGAMSIKAPKSAANKSGLKTVRIKITDFKIIKKLGEGSYGQVFLAVHKHTGSQYAIKVVEKRHLDTVGIDSMFEEQAIQRDLSKTHAGEFCLRLDASFHDSHYFYMVSPVMQGGDLCDEMFEHNPQGIHPVRAKNIMAQLVYGLNEMHKVGLLHRDVKSPNILLDSEGRTYIADFGLSRVFDRQPEDFRTSRFEAKKCDVTNRMCGTIGYAAPEILLGHKYSYAADTFSLGIVMKELLEGSAPFHGNGEDDEEVIRKTLYEKAPMCITPHFNIIAFHLNAAMLNKDPRQRITLEAAMRHPYFEDVNWEAIASRHSGFPPTACASFMTQSVQISSYTLPQWGWPCTPAKDPYPRFNYSSPDFTRSVGSALESSCCSSPDSSSSGCSSSPEPSIAESTSMHESTSFSRFKRSTMRLHGIARFLLMNLGLALSLKSKKFQKSRKNQKIQKIKDQN